MTTLKKKALKKGKKIVGALTGDAAERAQKRKLIAKRKAIAKNVAAKKKRDAAGMARATKLAQQGMATAKKRAKAGKPDSPEEILQRKLMIERGIYKPLPKYKAKFNVARERALADGATPAEAEQVARGIEPRYKGGPKKKAKPVTAKPKPKAAAAPKKKPKPKTAIVQTPKGFVRKKLQKHPKAAAAGGGKKPPNGNGKKAGAAAPKKTPKRDPKIPRMGRDPTRPKAGTDLAKKEEALAEKAYREILRLDAMYYKWGMPNAEWKAKRSAVIQKMGKDMDQYEAQAKRLGSTPKGKKRPNPWTKPKPKKK